MVTHGLDEDGQIPKLTLYARVDRGKGKIDRDRRGLEATFPADRGGMDA